MSDDKKSPKPSDASTTCESLLTTSDMYYRDKTRAQPVPGYSMAKRAARRRKHAPISLADYTQEIIHGKASNVGNQQQTRDARIGGDFYRRSVNLEEIQRILSAAEEADKASEGFVAKPLPARPRLREVLRGPQFRPPGTQNHIERMSTFRKKQFDDGEWRKKVDGKVINDEANDIWPAIVKGRWRELDHILDK